MAGAAALPGSVTPADCEANSERSAGRLPRTPSATRAKTATAKRIALPFPPDDPLYGIAPSPMGVSLGQLRLLGERGTLRIPASHMVRLRWNPFHQHMTDRVLAFTGLADESLDCR